jgi:hypothetical protein
MSSIKSTIARKAVKATARHSAHGTASKLRREPVRATTLLAVGVLLGAGAGWAAGRAGAAPSAG